MYTVCMTLINQQCWKVNHLAFWVWIGTGLITFVVNDNWIGVIPFLIGLILLYFGLTQPEDEQTRDENTDE